MKTLWLVIIFAAYLATIYFNLSLAISIPLTALATFGFYAVMLGVKSIEKYVDYTGYTTATVLGIIAGFTIGFASVDIPSGTGAGQDNHYMGSVLLVMLQIAFAFQVFYVPLALLYNTEKEQWKGKRREEIGAASKLVPQS
jgi:hypothetical protein